MGRVGKHPALRVPSVVVSAENTVLISPRHPAFEEGMIEGPFDPEIDGHRWGLVNPFFPGLFEKVSGVEAWLSVCPFVDAESFELLQVASRLPDVLPANSVETPTSQDVELTVIGLESVVEGLLLSPPLPSELAIDGVAGQPVAVSLQTTLQLPSLIVLGLLPVGFRERRQGTGHLHQSATGGQSIPSSFFSWVHVLFIYPIGHRVHGFPA